MKLYHIMDLINESALSSRLYHFTELHGAFRILKTKTLKAGWFNENKWISFTNDPNYHANHAKQLPGPPDVRFEFDSGILAGVPTSHGQQKHEPGEITADVKTLKFQYSDVVSLSINLNTEHSRYSDVRENFYSVMKIARQHNIPISALN